MWDFDKCLLKGDLLVQVFFMQVQPGTVQYLLLELKSKDGLLLFVALMNFLKLQKGF